MVKKPRRNGCRNSPRAGSAKRRQQTAHALQPIEAQGGIFSAVFGVHRLRDTTTALWTAAIAPNDTHGRTEGDGNDPADAARSRRVLAAAGPAPEAATGVVLGRGSVEWRGAAAAAGAVATGVGRLIVRPRRRVRIDLSSTGSRVGYGPNAPHLPMNQSINQSRKGRRNKSAVIVHKGHPIHHTLPTHCQQAEASPATTAAGALVWQPGRHATRRCRR